MVDNMMKLHDVPLLVTNNAPFRHQKGMAPAHRIERAPSLSVALFRLVDWRHRLPVGVTFRRSASAGLHGFDGGTDARRQEDGSQSDHGERYHGQYVSILHGRISPRSHPIGVAALC
jgi:hypothetical protein